MRRYAVSVGNLMCKGVQRGIRAYHPSAGAASKRVIRLLPLLLLMGCAARSEVLFVGEELPSFQINMIGIEWTIECQGDTAYTVLHPRKSFPHATAIYVTDGRTCEQMKAFVESIPDLTSEEQEW